MNMADEFTLTFSIHPHPSVEQMNRLIHPFVMLNSGPIWHTVLSSSSREEKENGSSQDSRKKGEEES